jgi:hypothetical protein
MNRTLLPGPIRSIFPEIGLTFISLVLNSAYGLVRIFLFVAMSYTNHLFVEGAPAGRRTLLSRSIQTEYTERACRWSFPDGRFTKVPASPMLERWNKFGALKLQVDRLAQVDGGIDPWQYACVFATIIRSLYNIFINRCVHSPDGFKRPNTLLRPYYEIKVGSPFPNLCSSADTNLPSFSKAVIIGTYLTFLSFEGR